jgi:hypothetical protein
MNIEEKLDLVLNYFKRNKKHNDNEWQIVSTKVGIELNEIVMKLFKDELIIKRDDLAEISLTINGQLFEGYVKRKRLAKLTRFLLFMESLLLVIFSAIGAIWIIIEISNKYFKK